jgi:hypothetical protein
MEYMTEEEEKEFAVHEFGDTVELTNGAVFSAAHIARYGAGDWGTTSVVLEKPAVSDNVGVFEYRAVVNCNANVEKAGVEGPVLGGAILGACLARDHGGRDNGQDNEIRRRSDPKDKTLGGPRSTLAADAASSSAPKQLSSSTRAPQIPETTQLNNLCSIRFPLLQALSASSTANSASKRSTATPTKLAR